jgi:hypothetical protein
MPNICAHFVHFLLLLMELLPATADCAAQLIGVGDVSGCKVAGSNLGIHLNLGIWGNQVVRNGNTLQDLAKSLYKKVNG